MDGSQPPQRPPGKPPAPGVPPAPRPTGSVPAVTPAPPGRPAHTPVPPGRPAHTPVPPGRPAHTPAPPAAGGAPRATGTMPALTPVPPGGPALTPAPAAPRALATTPDGQAAAALVSALSKAARSFTLYDPSNAVVRGFLEDYKAKAEAATVSGALVMGVRPFQMIREGEVVYQEEDRERSLSFRLFRDGVRQLSFEPGVPWDELLRFLEILAIRYTGVRQQEDDSVTLLRKAEFQGIGFQAVEGFVPEEDDPEPVEKISRAEADASPPPDFDTPFPALPAPAPYDLWPLPDASLADLHADEAPEAFGRTALGAVAVLIREATRGTLAIADVRQFVVEARDYFIADGTVPALADLADLVARQPAGKLRDELLRALGDPRVLELLLAGLGEGSELPPEAARLVPLVSASDVLDLLGTDLLPARRAALVKIVEARLPADAMAVLERLPRLDGATAKLLSKGLLERAPEHGGAVLVKLLEHPDDALKIASLKGLETAKGEVETAAVVPLLRARGEGVRVGAAHLLERRGEAEAFQPLHDALLGRKELSRAEADALGRALAMVHPARAMALFVQWARAKKGLLQKAFTGTGQEELLRWAAVSGLGVLPAPEAQGLIEEVGRGADEELKKHCFAVLARRRHEGARHG